MRGRVARVMARVVLVFGGALLMSCLGSVGERDCADFPRDAPECAEYWAAQAGGASGQAGVGGASAGGAGGDAGDGGQGAGAEPGTGGFAAIDGSGGGAGSGGDAGSAGLGTGGVGGGAGEAAAGGEPPGECIPTESRACATGLAGRCRSGQQVCDDDGRWRPCQADAEPGDEACDGASDEDCDGMVDEGCDCRPGETQDCGVSDIGLCRLGVQACEDGVYGACVGAVEPLRELCNDADDDCDGNTDEDFDLVGECTVGVGACAAPGLLACTIDGRATECLGAPFPGNAEVCNTIDDDCDGAVDEGYALGERCELGLGVCARAGVTRCEPGGVRPQCHVNGDLGGPNGPDDNCDDRDDDCDGRVDEAAGQCGLFPDVAIIEPADNVEIRYDGFDEEAGMWYADIDFVAGINDPEDGAIDGEQVRWMTDQVQLQDRILGHGARLTARLYSNNCGGLTHTIQLRVVDSDGNAVIVGIRVRIWMLC